MLYFVIVLCTWWSHDGHMHHPYILCYTLLLCCVHDGHMHHPYILCCTLLLCCIPYCSCWDNYDIIIFYFPRGWGICPEVGNLPSPLCMKPCYLSISNDLLLFLVGLNWMWLCLLMKSQVCRSLEKVTNHGLQCKKDQSIYISGAW